MRPPSQNQHWFSSRVVVQFTIDGRGGTFAPCRTDGLAIATLTAPSTPGEYGVQADLPDSPLVASLIVQTGAPGPEEPLRDTGPQRTVPFIALGGDLLVAGERADRSSPNAPTVSVLTVLPLDAYRAALACVRAYLDGEVVERNGFSAALTWPAGLGLPHLPLDVHRARGRWTGCGGRRSRLRRRRRPSSLDPLGDHRASYIGLVTVDPRRDTLWTSIHNLSVTARPARSVTSTSRVAGRALDSSRNTTTTPSIGTMSGRPRRATRRASASNRWGIRSTRRGRGASP